MLIKRGFSLNDYKNDKNTQEIEFNFIAEYRPPYAYKLISGNIGVSGSKITLPLYMAMFLPAGGEGAEKLHL